MIMTELLRKIKRKLKQAFFIKLAPFRWLLPLEPLSRQFGFERGQAIDRYYIEKFLKENQSSISGNVLEVGDSRYSHQFGQRVKLYSVLHVDPKNPDATLVGNLEKPETLPENRFHCFICTQTFQYIYNFEEGIRGAYRLIAPGGVLLATFPAVSQRSTGGTDRWVDYWRFTSPSVERGFSRFFGKENTTVKAYGNAYVSSCFLMGLAAEEIPKAKLDYEDPDYEFLITVRAVKRK